MDWVGEMGFSMPGIKHQRGVFVASSVMFFREASSELYSRNHSKRHFKFEIYAMDFDGAV
jgi:hypothetical protein